MGVAQERRATKRRVKASQVEESVEEIPAEDAALDEDRRVARMLVKRHLGVLKRLAKR